MSSKIIIFAAIILLIASFSILFIIEVKNHNYDYKKSWSVVYFDNPRDDSADFVIENHLGEKTEYNYEILVDDKKVSGDKIEIDAGAKQKISPVIGEDLKSKRVEIVVSCKDTKYKIYKDLQ